MSEARPMRAQVLVADIGGTNARFALAELDTLALSEIRQVRCGDHPSLEATLGDYLGTLPARPDHAAIAVAGRWRAPKSVSPIRPGLLPRPSFAAAFRSRASCCSTTLLLLPCHCRIFRPPTCIRSAGRRRSSTRPRRCSDLAPVSASPVSSGRGRADFATLTGAAASLRSAAARS